MNQKAENNIPLLSKDIMQYIVGYLPPEDLKKMAQVNKQCNSFFKPTTDKPLQFNRFKQKQEGIVKFYTQYDVQFAIHYNEQQPLLFASGRNASPNLGIGNYSETTKLTYCVLPNNLKKIKDVAIGSEHTLILYEDKQHQNKILAAGSNACGQIGGTSDNFASINTFQSMPLPDELKNPAGICAGDNHTHIWGHGEDGQIQIWATGRNHCGQLGLGTVDNQSQLALCPKPDNLKEITSMSAGDILTMIHGKNLNDKPQIWFTSNDPNNNYKFTPLSFPVEDGEIKQIGTGCDNAVIWINDRLTKQPRLFVLGKNQYGQLGLNEKENGSTLTELALPESLDEMLGMSISGYKSVIWGLDDNKQFKIWHVGLYPGEIVKYNINWTPLQLPSELKAISHVHPGYITHIQGTDIHNKPQIWQQNKLILPPRIAACIFIEHHLFRSIETSLF